MMNEAHVTTVRYTCGHETEYTSQRNLGLDELERVPVMCAECEVESNSLACVVCGETHLKGESMITLPALNAAGTYCLERRERENQARADAIEAISPVSFIFG